MELATGNKYKERSCPHRGNRKGESSKIKREVYVTGLTRGAGLALVGTLISLIPGIADDRGDESGLFGTIAAIHLRPAYSHF